MTKIEEARTALGISRSRLAGAAGLTEKALYMIERRGVKPRLTSLRAIASALDCQVADIEERG